MFRRPMLIGLVTALLLTGCVKTAVEDGILRGLQARLGPADHYEVTVSRTSTDELTHGIIHELHVEASRVLPPGAPAIDLLSATVLEMRADPATQTFQTAQVADLAMTFREQDLLRFVKTHNRDLADLQINFLQKEALVKMADFPLTHEPLRISGTVTLNAKQQVLFVPNQAFLGDDLMDPLMLDTLMDQVNPMADLSAWPLRVNLKSVSYQPGTVRIEGTIASIR